jgi:alpha-tubulin suppressor-like RCC1 family protein
LGIETQDNQYLPVLLNSTALYERKITKIFGLHTIDSENNVFTWGGSDTIGIPPYKGSTIYYEPILVNYTGVLSGKNISSISCGEKHTLTTDATGNVYAWGEASIGSGTCTRSYEPVMLNNSIGVLPANITAVATGTYHSLVLDSNGALYSWGNDMYLGGGVSYSVAELHPTTATLLEDMNITQIFGDAALDSNGSPYIIQTYGVVNLTRYVLGSTVAVSSSRFNFNKHSLAISSTGIMYSWGYNVDGQLVCKKQLSD